MKQYILSGAAIIALLFASCSEDNLDIEQKGVVSYESFYGDPANAENAAVFLYQTAQYGHWLGGGWSDSKWVWQGAIYLMQNACADDLYFASGTKDDHTLGLEMNEYRSTFSSNSAVPFNSYGAFFNMIRGCNLLLDNYSYDMVPDDPELNKIVNRSVSEAKVLRAYAHFMLATYWGNPPMADHVLAGDEKPGNTPHNDVIAFCLQDLADATADNGCLPSKSNVDDADMTVRFTKEYALALKGKIEVYNGMYPEAKADLKEVISSGLYELVDGKDMHKLFHVAGDCCKEKLMEFNFIDDPVNINDFSGQYNYHFVNSTSWRNLRAFPQQVNNSGWGSMNPSKSFGDDLLQNDCGVDFENDTESSRAERWRRLAWLVSYDEILSGKIIAGDTILSYGEKATYYKRGVASSGVYGCAGYWQYKRLPLNSDLITNNQNGDNKATDVNYVLMRYAEVLLLYAEACAQTNDPDGLQYLNQVQKRANSKHISSECTMAEVKNEKRFELFLEGSRFADLIRWGEAYDVLKEQGGSVPTYKDHCSEKASDCYNTKHDPYIEWASYNEEYGFKQHKHELMPYPIEATSVNPNLKQNPGWGGESDEAPLSDFDWLYNK